MPDAQLRRYRLPLNGGAATYEVLSDRPIELPRINYRQRNGRSYRLAYGVSRSAQGRFLDQLVKADVAQQTTQVWYEGGCFPGEPVFVAAPDSRSEDDGVILSVVLDFRSRNSFLLVLHAGSFEELSRAEVPCEPR